MGLISLSHNNRPVINNFVWCRYAECSSETEIRRSVIILIKQQYNIFLPLYIGLIDDSVTLSQYTANVNYLLTYVLPFDILYINTEYC